jgi:hypothetical protein
MIIKINKGDDEKEKYHQKSQWKKIKKDKKEENNQNQQWWRGKREMTIEIINREDDKEKGR